jgi:hypothetical protein
LVAELLKSPVELEPVPTQYLYLVRTLALELAERQQLLRQLLWQLSQEH